jgi:protein-disulfide isomerase
MDPKKRQQMIIIGAVVAVAVIAVVALIFLSGGTPESTIDFQALNPTRTDDGAFIIGDPDAPITVIEFADFGCPHCLEYKPAIEQVIRDFVVPGKARFEFRIFPTAGGELTRFAGQIAQCMEEETPGSFWKAYDLFFNLSASGQYSDRLGQIAADRLGFDYGQLLDCTQDADQVQTDVALGQRVGVGGTPAVMIRYGDGEPQFIPGYDRGPAPYDAIAQVVNQAQ